MFLRILHSKSRGPSFLSCIVVTVDGLSLKKTFPAIWDSALGAESCQQSLLMHGIVLLALHQIEPFLSSGTGLWSCSCWMVWLSFPCAGEVHGQGESCGQDSFLCEIFFRHALSNPSMNTTIFCSGQSHFSVMSMHLDPDQSILMVHASLRVHKRCNVSLLMRHLMPKLSTMRANAAMFVLWVHEHNVHVVGACPCRAACSMSMSGAMFLVWGSSRMHLLISACGNPL